MKQWWRHLPRIKYNRPPAGTDDYFSKLFKEVEQWFKFVGWCIVIGTKSVEMMLLAARHDIRVRGYRDIGSHLSSILPNITLLMPLEAVADKAGQRRMQTFPPYSLSFEANIPTLLAEVAKQVKPVEDARSRINPFDAFNEASEVIIHH